jgi:hypothetical protein
MKTTTLIAFLAFGAAAPSAWSAESITLHARTAGELADLCGVAPKETAADAKINYCHGFAQGVIDMERKRPGDTKPFCIPTPSPSRSATMTEFAAWVRSIPDRRGMPATDGLLKFMAERFPCK